MRERRRFYRKLLSVFLFSVAAASFGATTVQMNVHNIEKTWVGYETWSLGTAVDSAGYVYVAFYTDAYYEDPFYQAYLPHNWVGSTGPYFDWANGHDMFDIYVAKYTPATGQQVWGSFINAFERNDMTFDWWLGDLAVDPAGNIYITSTTNNRPYWLYTFGATYTDSWGPGDVGDEGYDVFVLKLKKSYWYDNQYSKEYVACFGGSRLDIGDGLAVDPAGDHIYVTGHTESPDFLQGAQYLWQTPPYDDEYEAPQDTFVAKFDYDRPLYPWWLGDFDLHFATYHGGDGVDNGLDIAVDSGGLIYVAGNTGSNEDSWGDPDNILGEYQDNPTPMNGDPMLSKFAADGDHVWTSYCNLALPPGWSSEPTQNNDSANGVAVDENGHVWIAGHIANYGPGSSNLLLAKFTPDGEYLLHTYVFGTGDDTAKAIAADGQGHVYVTGWTTANNLLYEPPTWRGDDAVLNEQDNFLMKFSLDGACLYSTYINGENEDEGDWMRWEGYWTGVAARSNGKVYVTGSTASYDRDQAKPGLYCFDPYWGEYNIDPVYYYDGFDRPNPASESPAYANYIGENWVADRASKFAVSNNLLMYWKDEPIRAYVTDTVLCTYPGGRVNPGSTIKTQIFWSEQQPDWPTFCIDFIDAADEVVFSLWARRSWHSPSSPNRYHNTYVYRRLGVPSSVLLLQDWPIGWNQFDQIEIELPSLYEMKVWVNSQYVGSVDIPDQGPNDWSDLRLRFRAYSYSAGTWDFYQAYVNYVEILP